MHQLIFSIFFVVIIFVLVSFSMLLGYAWGQLQKKSAAEEDSFDTRVLHTTIFAIMGLLIAFTFSGANNRLDERRRALIDEANSIMTFYYSLNSLPLEIRTKEHEKLRQYVNFRIGWYTVQTDKEAMIKEREKYQHIAQEMLKSLNDYCNSATNQNGCSAAHYALVGLITLENKNFFYKRLHPPLILYCMLLGIVFSGVFIAGYNIKGKLADVVSHQLIFSAVISIMLFIIINLEYPYVGVFSHSAFDGFNSAFTAIQNLLSTTQPN